MNKTVVPDAEAFDRVAADLIGRHLAQKPASVIGLATGNTTHGVFDEFIRRYEKGEMDFSEAITFNIDEYVGVPPSDPAGITSRMEANFFSRVNMKKNNGHIPDPTAASPEEECRRFGELLASHGGMDVLLLSVGPNGHIGFNEPGTPFGSSVHVADIAVESRQIRVDFFGSIEKVPRQGITLGIKDIMHARHIVLVAKGEAKAAVIRAACEGPVVESVPASVLQLHPALDLIIDEGAASCISRANSLKGLQG